MGGGHFEMEVSKNLERDSKDTRLNLHWVQDQLGSSNELYIALGKDSQLGAPFMV